MYNNDNVVAFVIGNGQSRKNIEIDNLKKYGKLIGCNALYRDITPDYLIAVDVKMIFEIDKNQIQYRCPVWTNYNKSFKDICNLNYFRPKKGWSSGPTALNMAVQLGFKHIYILGFDFKGLEDGEKVNNIYADTKNYKKSHDGATYYGNWLKQTCNVLQNNKKINFVRVIQPDNFCPEELNNLDNLTHMYYEDFEKIFNLK